MEFNLRQYLSENKLMKEQEVPEITDRRIQDAVNYLIDEFAVASLEEALQILYHAKVIYLDNDGNVEWIFEPNKEFEKDMGRPYTVEYHIREYMRKEHSPTDDSDVPDDEEPLPEPDDQAVELPADQSVDTLNYEETEVDKKLLELIESELDIAQKDTTDYRKRYVDAVVKVENDTIQTIESQIQQEPVQVPDVEELKQTILSQLIDKFEETYGISMKEGDTTALADKANELARDSVMKVIEQNKEILGADEQEQQAIDSVQDAVESTKSDREKLESELREDFGDAAVDSAATGDDGDGDGIGFGGAALFGGLMTLVLYGAGFALFLTILIFAILALLSLLKSDDRKNLQESNIETLVEYELRKTRVLTEEKKQEIVNTTRSKVKNIISSIRQLSLFTGIKTLIAIFFSSGKLYQLYREPQKTNIAEVTSFVNELAAKIQQQGEKEQKNKEHISKIISEFVSLIKA